jgi:capsular polysaccharide biosynthesis protein
MTNAQNLTTSMKDATETVWRHRLLVVVVFAALLAVAAFIVFKLERQYVAGANVLVVNGNTRQDPTLSSPDLPSIATSTVVLDRVVKDLQLDIPVLIIKKGLTVKPPAYKSSIMRIEYTDEYPERAAQIANGVADELTRYYGEISTARYDADLNALNRELSKESDRIKSISQQMEARGGSAVTAIDDKGNDPVAGRLSALETDRALSGATLQGDIAGAAALAPGSSTDSKQYRRDVLQSDPTYMSLQTAVAASQVALDTDHALYTDQYPGLPAIEHKVQSLRSSLNHEASLAISAPDAYSPAIAANEAAKRKADAVVVADQARVAALDGLVASEEARQAAQTPLETLRLQRDAAQSEYLAISTRRATALADRADALSLGSVVVVDRAIASEVQVGLGRTSLAAVLTLLVLTLSICSAFLADLFDPRMRRIAQIESLYGRPVIATIGKM